MDEMGGRGMLMRPTETLKREHQVILMVLDAAEREVQWSREAGQVHADDVDKMADFFRHFADRCHHAKERGFTSVTTSWLTN